jgi:hypothetical protein
MRCVKIVCYAPNGGQLTLQAAQGGELIIDHVNPDARFVDIRDTALGKHESGHVQLIAQVPTSWALSLELERIES